MPRPADTALRTVLVERAADLLARREPVSLRGLVAGTGASTMAVYTHFGGMPGLWRAVRQEGFTRLGARLGAVASTDDPVRDLAALAAAYVGHAMEHPTLYRVMFDAAADLEDPSAAGHGLGLLVDAAHRARDTGRFAADRDPSALATRLWASGHGLVLLVIGGVLPRAELDVQAPALVLDLCLAAGDDPARAADSVRRGWGEGTALG